MPETLILDTGFWIGLYESSDANHEKATTLAAYLDLCTLLLPWPSLYETLNTRFVRRTAWMRAFEQLFSRPGTILLPDDAYRHDALTQVFRGHHSRSGISLVDMVIRAMIADTNINIDAMITFNRRDFFDVCQARNIAILSD